MDKNKLKKAKEWFESELDGCIGFWTKYGYDRKNGGMFTCLDRKGELFSEDKSVWMQGRAAWTYAYLCTVFGKKDEWLEISKSCLDFLENHCINHDAGDRLFFTVTGDGKPLRQRRYCFSEGFYAIANAEYYANTGEEIYLKRAKWAYETIYNLTHGLIKDPTGFGPKTDPNTRQMRSFADEMIYLNITSVMRRVDKESEDLYNERAKECALNIEKYFYRPELKCLLESVGIDGKPMLDTVAGRIVNPGHDIEGSWFLQEYANYSKDEHMSEVAREIYNNAINAGWDEKLGGILYFTDALGKPPEAYEHDMKLWWVHNETLIASLMFYKDTKDEKYLDWFYKTLDYCKEHFADPTYGEWYGYLRRDGNPTEPPCKGSTFKGPFHVPRCLAMSIQLIDEILGE